MKTKILDIIQWSSCIFGVTLNQLDDLLSITLGFISILFSILIGIVNIIIKIKEIKADGKITKEELEDLKSTINKTKEDIKNDK